MGTIFNGVNPFVWIVIALLAGLFLAGVTRPKHEDGQEQDDPNFLIRLGGFTLLFIVIGLIVWLIFFGGILILVAPR